VILAKADLLIVDYPSAEADGNELESYFQFIAVRFSGRAR